MKNTALSIVLALIQVRSLHSQTCAYQRSEEDYGIINDDDVVSIDIPSSTRLYAAPKETHTVELHITNLQVRFGNYKRSSETFEPPSFSSFILGRASLFCATI